MYSHVDLKLQRFSLFFTPLFFVKDGGFGPAAAPGLVLQGPVEYFGLHCGQWSSGGIRVHVSHATHTSTLLSSALKLRHRYAHMLDLGGLNNLNHIAGKGENIQAECWCYRNVMKIRFACSFVSLTFAAYTLLDFFF